MRKIFDRLIKGFYKACDSFSSKMHAKGYRYNDLGSMVVKLALISFILMLIILGLIILLILL